eukprot:jgi/Mesvir1/8950/Mv22981-RA.2
MAAAIPSDAQGDMGTGQGAPGQPAGVAKRLSFNTTDAAARTSTGGGTSGSGETSLSTGNGDRPRASSRPAGSSTAQQEANMVRADLNTVGAGPASKAVSLASAPQAEAKHKPQPRVVKSRFMDTLSSKVSSTSRNSNDPTAATKQPPSVTNKGGPSASIGTSSPQNGTTKHLLSSAPDTSRTRQGILTEGPHVAQSARSQPSLGASREPSAERTRRSSANPAAVERRPRSVSPSLHRSSAHQQPPHQQPGGAAKSPGEKDPAGQPERGPVRPASAGKQPPHQQHHQHQPHGRPLSAGRMPGFASSSSGRANLSPTAADTQAHTSSAAAAGTGTARRRDEGASSARRRQALSVSPVRRHKPSTVRAAAGMGEGSEDVACRRDGLQATGVASQGGSSMVAGMEGSRSSRDLGGSEREGVESMGAVRDSTDARIWSARGQRTPVATGAAAAGAPDSGTEGNASSSGYGYPQMGGSAGISAMLASGTMLARGPLGGGAGEPAPGMPRRRLVQGIGGRAGPGGAASGVTLTHDVMSLIAGGGGVVDKVPIPAEEKTANCAGDVGGDRDGDRLSVHERHFAAAATAVMSTRVSSSLMSSSSFATPVHPHGGGVSATIYAGNGVPGSFQTTKTPSTGNSDRADEELCESSHGAVYSSAHGAVYSSAVDRNAAVGGDAAIGGASVERSSQVARGAGGANPLSVNRGGNAPLQAPAVVTLKGTPRGSAGQGGAPGGSLGDGSTGGGGGGAGVAGAGRVAAGSSGASGMSAVELQRRVQLAVNRLLQWQHVTLRLALAGEQQQAKAEAMLLAAWQAVEVLKSSVASLEMRLQSCQHTSRVDQVLSTQMPLLEQWQGASRALEDSFAVLSTAAEAALLRLPLTQNARGDGAALMDAVAGLVREVDCLEDKAGRDLQSSADEVASVSSSLASTVMQESQLLGRCHQLLQTLSSLEASLDTMNEAPTSIHEIPISITFLFIETVINFRSKIGTQLFMCFLKNLNLVLLALQFCVNFFLVAP